MSVEIRVPTLGESIVDATIAAWRKKEGEPVQRGETLAELETDKVNVEVSAGQAGTLQKILKQEGDTVTVGEVIGLLNEEAVPASNGAAAQTAPQTAQQTTSQAAPQAAPPEVQNRQPAVPQVAGQRPPSPLARRIAAEHNIDISKVQGTSPHGRVTREDVISYLERSAQQPAVPASAAVSAQAVPSSAAPAPAVPIPPPSVAQGRPEERVRMSRRRQTIARRLVEVQQTAAMLTTFNEIDMSKIIELRRRRREAFKERFGVSLGYMSFFTKAVVGALKAFPYLNAEIQGDEMVIKHYYDIGIAVGSEEGLVVPVVRDADRKSFAQIEREIADLAERARSGRLTLADLQGGTFTITNGGVYGSLLSTPILNGPQVGILGMHNIVQRPVAVNGQIEIRPMMYVALSYDHRIVDGSVSVRFLVRVKELLEDPETLLLEG
ncbi:MAG: 2-oxoglutarate dehydrogenase complex dihydrolipoyllysine-residue succinyltransferase [Ktedonobacteraceae bacterium]|nr:2-oxoglutarate dehydrogenase complex dihydrolipoyllysine-residue succinyltransferase [Ktedonobacteraceae bacterium]